ncbi:MAG: hypothetical protein QXT64_02515 [Desulfurococcaceae archaeon]
MSFLPPWLTEAIWEKKRGFKELLWELTMTIPAGQTITARVFVPQEEVWFERGYEFEPDALNVLRFSHWHDGLPQMMNILLTESILSWRYTKPEIVRSSFVVQITNEDTVDHAIHVKGLYRSIPREEFNKLMRVV